MITKDALQTYLRRHHDKTISVQEIHELGSGEHGSTQKAILSDKTTIIIKTWNPHGRNLEFVEERIRESLRIQRSSKLITNHADIHAIINKEGKPILAQEPVVLMQEITGTPYNKTLRSSYKRQYLSKQAIKKVTAISNYLADLHTQAPKKYYETYLKDWFATGILELVDEAIPQSQRLKYKKKFLTYQDKLSAKPKRCRVIHGEFFSENIHFTNNKIHTYDMRRIGYGEPADDVGSMLFDYYITSITEHGHITQEAFIAAKTFLNTYLNRTRDEEMLQILPCFMAYRTLIFCSPHIIDLNKEKREKMFMLLDFLLTQKTLNEQQLKKFNNKIKNY